MNYQNKPIPTSISLPASLLERADTFCTKKDISRTKLVKQALVSYLDKEENKE
jgi:metal-responsive CopG/Arc/MetJ family transcriptional regulator